MRRAALFLPVVSALSILIFVGGQLVRGQVGIQVLAREGSGTAQTLASLERSREALLQARSAIDDALVEVERALAEVRAEIPALADHEASLAKRRRLAWMMNLPGRWSRLASRSLEWMSTSWGPYLKSLEEVARDDHPPEPIVTIAARVEELVAVPGVSSECEESAAPLPGPAAEIPTGPVAPLPAVPVVEPTLTLPAPEADCPLLPTRI